ncbi:MAG: hypothetical protein ABR860_09930 [Terracidiphilus sp.]|jgi:hypothetical protein
MIGNEAAWGDVSRQAAVPERGGGGMFDANMPRFRCRTRCSSCGTANALAGKSSYLTRMVQMLPVVSEYS